MAKEKFGTDTPLYNKFWYNSRGQLAEMRVSTSYTGSGDTSWNRGAIINHYSNQCWGVCAGQSMTDNNGNVKKQEHEIPDNDQVSTWQAYLQTYSYDNLNRLQSVNETKWVNGNGTQTINQVFDYDRYGNRIINQAQTWGGINNKEFTVNSNNNRLSVPGGQTGVMTYDNAGNLTTDTYSGSGVTRVYDAENRMSSETQANNYLAGGYSYDADGQRVRRKVGNVETWQVYDFDGELLAEYAANAASTSPQKEYGYRDGQLLITAEPAPAPLRTNVAAVTNGGVASASSQESPYTTNYTNDGERLGYTSGQYSFWRDNTNSSWPDWLQIDFNGSKTVDEIDLFTVQDNAETPATPTEAMTFSLHGVTAFDVQYWDGSSWVTITGGSVTGNNKVWRKFTFAAITTSKIRVTVNAALNNRSRIVELEAYGTAAGPARNNVAQAANGGAATASSQESPYTTNYTNDGERLGYISGHYSFWRDNTNNTWPDWLQIDFNGNKTIDEIDVFTVQDNAETPSEPTESLTFSLHGITAFDVQYWDGSAWVTVPNGSVTGNNKVWRKFTFAAITTSKIRVTVNAALNTRSRIVEVEAWGTVASDGSSANINWLVSDQLGTPRMVFDQTGSLANMKRHDYLPFGEELFVGQGARTTQQGYVADNVRQKFTGYEHDGETGLEFAQARYYASVQGRFSGVDPVSGSAGSPQTWNGYAYVGNNPLKFIDPSGMNYFVGGGVNDPGIREYRVDGFDMGPEGTTSQLTGESMLTPYNELASVGNAGQDNRPYIGDMVSPNEGVGLMPDGSYRFKVNENGQIGHDGEHVLGTGDGSTVSAIRGLTGRVLTWLNQGGGAFSVFIQINKDTVMVLKDVESLSSTITKAPFTNAKGTFLDRFGNPTSKVSVKAGDLIGRTSKWSGRTNNSHVGLHFSFVRMQFIQQYRTNIGRLKASPVDYFIAPCGSSSPVRC